MPKQDAVAWAVEQINMGNLAGAKQLLDALLALPLSKFGKQERLGAFLARGTAWAMLAKHGQLQGAAPGHVGMCALSAQSIVTLKSALFSLAIPCTSGCAGAADDFTAAIEIEPRFADSYKRRGQARSAMGDLDGALQDFKSCIERSRDPRTRADCYMERGSIYQKQRDYSKAEAELHVCCNPCPLACKHVCPGMSFHKPPQIIMSKPG